MWRWAVFSREINRGYVNKLMHTLTLMTFSYIWEYKQGWLVHKAFISSSGFFPPPLQPIFCTTDPCFLMQCETSTKNNFRICKYLPSVLKLRQPIRFLSFFFSSNPFSNAPTMVSFPLDGASSFPQPRTEDDIQLLWFLWTVGAAFIFGAKAARVTFKAATTEFIFGVSSVELTGNAACTAVIHITCAAGRKQTQKTLIYISVTAVQFLAVPFKYNLCKYHKLLLPGAKLRLQPQGLYFHIFIPNVALNLLYSYSCKNLRQAS